MVDHTSILALSALVAIFAVFCVFLSAFKSGYGAFNDAYEYGAFSYHPVTMVSAFVFLGPTASLAYSVLENTWGIPHRAAKVVHGGLHAIAFTLGIVGFCSMYHTHDVKSMSHFQSLHSLVGMLTLVLYGVQFLGGLLVFGFGVTSMQTRTRFIVYHKFCGAAVSLLCVAVLLLGSLSLVWRGHESGVKCPESDHAGYVATGDQWASVNTAGFTLVIATLVASAAIVATNFRQHANDVTMTNAGDESSESLIVT